MKMRLSAAAVSTRWVPSPTDGSRVSAEGIRSRSWLRLPWELLLRVSQPSAPSDLKSHESSRACELKLQRR